MRDDDAANSVTVHTLIDGKVPTAGDSVKLTFDANGKMTNTPTTLKLGFNPAPAAALDITLDYVKSREAFGKPIGKFQNTRFVLAEMATEAYVARTFVNHCVELLNKGEVDTALASMAKWWTTELQTKLVDRAVQLHGGYGYMMEYPVARAYVDSRIQTIYGGTTEIQKEIIGRSLGL